MRNVDDFDCDQTTYLPLHCATPHCVVLQPNNAGSRVAAPRPDRQRTPLRGTNSYHVMTWCHYSHPGTAGLKFWPEPTRVRVPGDLLDVSRILEPMTSLPACSDSFSRLGISRL